MYKQISKTLFYSIIVLSLPMLWVVYLFFGLDIEFDPEDAKNVHKTGIDLSIGETPWWYLIINISAVFFPFILSFDKKVHFYKKWKFLFPAIFVTASFFIIWDIIFTHYGIWGFNEKYVNLFIFGLPLGEWLFFITVPYACVFIHECLICYFKSDPLRKYDRTISYFLIIFFIIVGLLNLYRIYTAWTFFISASFLLIHSLYIPNTFRTRFYIAYLISLIPFTIINGILTGGYNNEPVVIYNNTHNLTALLDHRFLSIPFDDFIYGFLLIFMTVSLYEYFKKEKVPQNL